MGFTAESVDFSYFDKVEVHYGPRDITAEAVMATEDNIGKLALEFEQDVVYPSGPIPEFKFSAEREGDDPILLTVRPTWWIIKIWNELHLFKDELFRKTFDLPKIKLPEYKSSEEREVDEQIMLKVRPYETLDNWRKRVGISAPYGVDDYLECGGSEILIDRTQERQDGENIDQWMARTGRPHPDKPNAQGPEETTILPAVGTVERYVNSPLTPLLPGETVEKWKERVTPEPVVGSIADLPGFEGATFAKGAPKGIFEPTEDGGMKFHQE